MMLVAWQKLNGSRSTLSLWTSCPRVFRMCPRSVGHRWLRPLLYVWSIKATPRGPVRRAGRLYDFRYSGVGVSSNRSDAAVLERPGRRHRTGGLRAGHPADALAHRLHGHRTLAEGHGVRLVAR